MGGYRKVALRTGTRSNPGKKSSANLSRFVLTAISQTHTGFTPPVKRSRAQNRRLRNDALARAELSRMPSAVTCVLSDVAETIGSGQFTSVRPVRLAFSRGLSGRNIFARRAAGGIADRTQACLTCCPVIRDEVIREKSNLFVSGCSSSTESRVNRG